MTHSPNTFPRAVKLTGAEMDATSPRYRRHMNHGASAIKRNMRRRQRRTLNSLTEER